MRGDPAMITAIWATWMGALGLCVGSFLNVVVHRVPAGLSVVSPGSACPGCAHGIRARHNVPVLGWLALRGRCFDCGMPISARYPLVEAGTAVLFAAVVLRFPDQPRLWPALLYVAAIGVALTLIDLDVRRLPDAIVLPSYPALAVLLVLAGDAPALTRALIGGLLLGAIYAAIALVSGAMGWGDVKLAGLLGAVLAYVSWEALILGGYLAFVLGAGVGIALLVLGRAGRRTAVPFGPFMIGAVLLTLLAL
ncbi:prepilin peptidase [Nocardioides nematodiphilus]|uniref:prepilin peptidase n=1 Tax=Nocardioides nematodiphilus TaxID=2849669 RepID=UPI001CD99EDE|nr:A24 family peptidase [Nocardioides nematodiphilus]MCA1984599.1 prepilin peptidase [Nocardioides nematodiphilus]